ncbi:hypothetical protein UFOVP2_10 [uncultured Caudovirales phage]|uniref:Helix-turn-helix domain containing protein n=1 Tax=uncultured Caudovirales phage TaxID=2100421 RepID=A0A6J5KI53_9CAUD|nr:hypothetical protein UFOVP2_10 [uncultured Caudovirales phage]
MSNQLSVHDRILIFFATNPEVVLTTVELCKKFGISKTTFNKMISRLKEGDTFCQLQYGYGVMPDNSRTGWKAGPALLDELGYDNEQSNRS